MADRNGWAREWLRYARVRFAGWRRRATPFGVVLRFVVWASGFAAVTLSIGGVNLRLAMASGTVLPLVAALRPRGPWTALTVMTAILGWTASTLLGEPSTTTAAFVGAAAYLHHASTAVAREWTTDAAVAVDVRRAWTRRTAAVVAGGLAVGLLVAGLAGRPVPLPSGALLPLGVALTLGVLVGIVHLARRGAPDEDRSPDATDG